MQIGFCRMRFTQNDNLIAADAAAAVADSAKEIFRGLEISGASVDNDEIIAKAVHFEEREG